MGGTAVLDPPLLSGLWTMECTVEKVSGWGAYVGVHNSIAEMSKPGNGRGSWTLQSGGFLSLNGKAIGRHHARFGEGAKVALIFNADTRILQWSVDGNLMPELPD